MALTKLPKNAIADDAIDASKIEDGTIQAVEVSGTIPETKLATGTIENAKLSNSTITINGTSISLGGSSSIGVEVNWQSVQTTGFTAVAGNGYFVDTTSGAITVTLPASASLGDQIAIKDYAGTFASNNLTIGRNGHNIQGVANDSLINTNRASLLLVYVDSTKGWLYAEESNIANLQNATFITATGGTITTSGDYKIHTFTGDGCFVVSQVGNPVGGADTVSYLVIAGGGSGGGHGGGGGAGGFREGRDITPSYTASPLVAPTGLTITATTYPVTVGAGGTAVNAGSIGNNGSNSVFSTITSTGGGGAGGDDSTVSTGNNGGSGGGAGYSGNPRSAASGNTPPVSPPQGNNGGINNTGGGGGGGTGGGGGASAVGGNGGPSTSGSGGSGTTTSITASPVGYAGGGGGMGWSSFTPGSGGSGGGGSGGSNGSNGTSGSTNTGGGGGGSGGGTPCTGIYSGAGGKGIVIIRYKYQ